MNRRVFLLAGLMTLGACATRPVLVAGPAGSALEELEPLYGVSSNWRRVTVLVASRGCATRADFVSHVERGRGGPAAIAFARRRIETCPTGARRLTAVTFSYEQLGLAPGAPYYVLNPVRPRP